MIKKIFLLFLLFFCCTAFATSCTIAKDCEKIVNVGGVCVGQGQTYTRSATLPSGSTWSSDVWDSAIPLLGKRYTDKIQVAYKVNYNCINGQCVFKGKDTGKTDCDFGCLLEPVTYNGQTWQSFCVCKPGYDPAVKIHCGSGTNNRVGYDSYKDWTCETKDREIYSCSIGWRCKETSNSVTCEEIPGDGPFSYSNGASNWAASTSNVAYTFVLPKNIDGTIKVAAIQNGKVIAERAISGLSMHQYLDRYGTLNMSQAYSFAQSTGLMTTVAAIQKTRMATVASNTTTTRTTSAWTSASTGASSLSNYRASNATRTISVYAQPITTTAYKPTTKTTTVSASKPGTSSTTKKTTTATSTSSSTKKLSTTTTKRTSAYRTTATTAASATATTRKRSR